MSARFWTEERLQLVAHLWHEGKQESEIAAHFGKTVKAVHAARQHYGLVECRHSRTHAPYRRLAPKPHVEALPVVAWPGWPTLAQLMARR